MQADTPHPLPPGTAALVYSISIVRRPFVEGRIRIISPIEGESSLYRVMFTGEALPQVRFVHPDWQRDPTTTLNILNAYWRLNYDVALGHEARIPFIHREFSLRREDSFRRSASRSIDQSTKRNK
jgi:hypothetical protein